jgi:hypothetical protein
LTLTLGLLIASASAARTASPTPTFYEGKLSGGDVQGWTLWLSTTSSEGLAVAFGTGGPAPADHQVAVRGAGSIRKKGSGRAIDLKLYAVARENRDVRVGRIHAVSRGSGGSYTGKFTLAGRSGTFTAAPVPAVPISTTGLAGTYSTVRGEGDVALKLAGDGSFYLEGRVQGRTVGRAIGNWQVDTDGYLWLLPTSVAESNDFFDQTLKLRVPLKLRTMRSGSQLDLYEPIRNSHFASFVRQ